MDAVGQLLCDTIGLDAHSLGESTLDWAARQRMGARHAASIDAYAELARRDAAELAALIELVVVPESWFFREPAAFQLLESRARDLLRQPGRGAPIRLLSVPCSTGEEPYSIAMTLLHAGFPGEAFQIEAMDISAGALRRAELATYSANSFRGGEEPFRERFFSPIDADAYKVNAEVRELIRFQQGNILHPQSWLLPRAYDIVYCRNLLIYMDAAARHKTVQTLRGLLRPGGIIFVGHAEIPEMLKGGFHRCSEPRTFACCWREPEPVPPTWLPSPALAPPMAPGQTHAAEPPPFDPGAVLRRAAELADHGAYVQAASLCRDLLRVDPDHAPAYFWLGVIAQAEAQLETAEEFFHKALYLAPRHYEALVHLALLREGRGDSAGAALLRQRAQRALQSASPA